MNEWGMDEGIKDITIEPADIKREYSKLHMQTFNNLQEIEHLLRKFHDVLQKNPNKCFSQPNMHFSFSHFSLSASLNSKSTNSELDQ